MHIRRLDVDGNFQGFALRPRACATRTRETKARKPLGNACTWSEACLAADQAIDLLGGKQKDRGIWVWYCSYIGTDCFLNLAFEIASCVQQGELRDPVKAFQKRLQEILPKDSTNRSDLLVEKLVEKQEVSK